MKWDINDPDHRRVLETARAWGVSPSRFMGHESVVIEERIGAQTIYTREPEWKHEDREAAIALQDYEASLCSGCGQPLQQTSDPDKEFAYKASLPIRCHYCTASGRGQEAYEKTEHPHALHFPVMTIKPEGS